MKFESVKKQQEVMTEAQTAVWSFSCFYFIYNLINI